MTTLSDRLNTLEATLTLISLDYQKLATHDELEAAREEIFDPIDDAKISLDRIESLTTMNEQIIHAAQGR